MNQPHYLLGLFFLTLFLSCGSKKAAQTTPVVVFEQRDLDTLEVSAPKVDAPAESPQDEVYTLPKYNPTYTLRNDLLHTDLNLKFDWPNQHVIGIATLTLKPYFYPTRILELDAKDFDINSIKLSGKDLKYDYNGEILTIDLGKTYQKDQEYTIVIDYIAKPAETGGQGGSAAITSDQGLFFINHDQSDPNKPMQIWTQGETEWNSRWFPTIDKPNERCTQEMHLTVQDRFKTLSNGLMTGSDKNADGTRTDHWKMDQPHAPYLFMIAVGEFAVVKDSWDGMLVDYYVEPEYEKDAKAIFAHTPEMLSFFSEKLGVKYPWKKYSQVVVRDYVSGAMENTTGVIFGEFVQQTTQDLIDNNNDGIVAHELFHHWFGDYVTCESWANLTMNEGFANYSEYLWFEHKYGKDRADSHRRSEMQGYVGSVGQGGAHPLIHFEHDDKEDMFDAHSYNKGGLVLHMLRSYVGDDAFFAALKLYLNENAYTAVEAHDLRLAFEEVTGEDLNWFFNQWYFEQGHPVLNINYDYDATAGKLDVIIQQEQDPKANPPIFQLPFAIDIYTDAGAPMRTEVLMNQRKQVFSFDVPSKPLLVNVDADKVLLAEKRDNKTDDALIFQYKNGKNYFDRYEALQALGGKSSSNIQSVFEMGLGDPYWGLRSKAISLIDLKANPATLPKLAEIGRKDPHSAVRAAAFNKLADAGDSKYIGAAKQAIDQDKVSRVQAAALNALYAMTPSEALNYATKLEESKSVTILGAVSNIYADQKDLSKLAFFSKNMSKVDGYGAMDYFENYFSILQSADDATVSENTSLMKDLAVDMGQSPWRRFAATKTINDIRGFYLDKADKAASAEKQTSLRSGADKLTQMIETIKAAETNDQLKLIYQRF